MKKHLFQLLLICFFTFNATIVCANPIKKLFENGMVAFTQGRFDDAIKYYEKILEIYPKFAPAYNYLGMAHKEKGVPLKDVVWYFEQAVIHKTDYADAYANLGKTYYTLGRFEEAKEAGLRAVELKPNSTTAHLALAWTYLLGLSQPDDAVYHFERVDKKVDMPYAYFGLGMAYFMNHQTPEMLGMITKLRQSDREDLATELERMTRDQRYEALVDRGQPLLTPEVRTTTSRLIRDVPVSTIAQSSEGNMEVNVRKSSPQLSPRQESQAQAGLSGTQRIRQLQQKARSSQPKGSGY